MKKKILIVTEYFYPEEFKINEIALKWKKDGYDVDVLTQNPTYPFGKIFKGFENKWFKKDIYEGINIYRVKAVTGYKDSFFKKASISIFSFSANKIKSLRPTSSATTPSFSSVPIKRGESQFGRSVLVVTLIP